MRADAGSLAGTSNCVSESLSLECPGIFIVMCGSGSVSGLLTLHVRTHEEQGLRASTRDVLLSSAVSRKYVQIVPEEGQLKGSKAANFVKKATSSNYIARLGFTKKCFRDFWLVWRVVLLFWCVLLCCC